MKRSPNQEKKVKKNIFFIFFLELKKLFLSLHSYKPARAWVWAINNIDGMRLLAGCMASLERTFS